MKMHTNPCPFSWILAVVVAAFAILSASSTLAASGTWTGATNANWNNNGNWTASPFPNGASGQVATFNNTAAAVNNNTSITLGQNITLTGIVFDTAAAAAYTINAGNTITMGSSSTVLVNSSVVNHQVFNNSMQLGGNGGAASYNFTNSSTSANLTFGGSIVGGTGGTPGTKTLNVSGAGNVFLNGSISYGDADELTIDKSGAGALSISGNITKAGVLNLSAGGGNFTVSGNIGGTNNSVNMTGSSNGEISGNITVAFAVNKSGTGTWILSGNNSYTTATNVNAGVLNIQHNNALGTGAAGVTVTSGARLELENGITVTGRTATISGTGGNNFGALQSNSGDNTWAGGVMLGTTETRIGANAAGSVLRVSGVIDDGVNTFNLVVRNNLGLTELSGANTYGGSTRIFNGTLRLAGGSNRLPTGTTVELGTAAISGTLDLNGQNQTIAALATAGTGTANTVTSVASATLTLGGSATSDFTSGTISGAVALTQNGTGTLTLGNNSYTGATIINNGVVVATHANSLGATAGATTVNNGGRLELSGGITLAENFTIDGGGGNFFGAIQSVSGNNTLTGAVSLGSNAPRIATAGSGNVIEVAGTIQNGAGNSVAVRHENANGLAIFSGNNTYTGATQVIFGILRITHANALGTTAGGTQLANSTNLSAALELANNITLNDALVIGTTGTGLGTLRNFSDSNQWAGNIAQNNQMAFDAAAGNLLISGDITGSGNSLFLRGASTGQISGNITVASPISGALVRKLDAGMWTLSGTNSYGVPTNIEAGRLNIDGTHNNAATYTVFSGGVLGGSGTINFANNQEVKVQATPGVISPGAGFSGSGPASPANVGTLTLSGTGLVVDMDGILQIDIASPALFDQLIVGGTFDIDNNAFLNINGSTALAFVDYLALGFSVGSRVDLVSATAIVGNFSNFPANQAIDTPGGLRVFFGLDNNSLYLLAVPEPSSMALWAILGGLGFVCGWRRLRAGRERKQTHAI